MTHQFCDRCGKYFRAETVSLECGACVYAADPQRAVLGYAQRTPLIKKLVNA